MAKIVRRETTSWSVTICIKISPVVLAVRSWLDMLADLQKPINWRRELELLLHLSHVLPSSVFIAKTTAEIAAALVIEVGNVG